MSCARDTWLLFRRQLRLSLRHPVWVAIGLAQPILYLVFFGPLFARVFNTGLTRATGSAYGYFVPGLLIQLGLYAATSVGFTIIAEWRYGVTERLRVTPVSRIAMLAGRVLRDVATLTIQAIVLVVVGMAFGLRAPVAGVLIGLGFIAVAGVSLASLSYSVGLLSKNEEVLAPALNTGLVPLVLLSGVMLPLSIGPGWLQGVARAMPFRYILNAMRQAYIGHYANSIMLEGILMAVGLAAASVWIASLVFLHENA
jgi:ABC-2 type transport system permease protein